MHIEKVRVRHFRSIDDLVLSVDDLSLFCGPNSCGKSNFFRALQFAFRPDEELSENTIYENLISSKRDTPGGPHLSIYVDITFAECPKEIHDFAQVPEGEPIEYNFRAIRTGTITRDLGEYDREESEPGNEVLNLLKEHFDIIFVPPIRDLTAGGMKPFQRLLGAALRRSRRQTDLSQPAEEAKDVLRNKADSILSEHASFAEDTLHVDGLELDTEKVTLEDLYEDVSLDVTVGGERTPMSDLGTGHQSALIIHLYRQLGEVSDCDTLFLFEEPGNHLHPSTTRTIGNDLQEISDDTQVFVTTHSPLLIRHFGFESLCALEMNEEHVTEHREVDLQGLSDGELRVLFRHHGLRLTEPLLSRRIVVVEGASDAVLLSRLIARRCGCTVDQMDMVVVPAGGADRVVELSKLLHRLDVEWRVVFDWDVAIGGNSPLTEDGLSEEDEEAASKALDTITEILSSGRRGKGVSKSLRKISEELENGRSSPKVYEGSKLETFLEGDNQAQQITRADRRKLVPALKDQHVTDFQPILNKYNAWLWRDDIEGAVMYKDGSADILERVLVDEEVIPDPIKGVDNRKERLQNTLHGKAQKDPLVLKKVIDELDKQKMFSRTQMNKAVRWITEDLP
jgi:predicted ATP-dependent endonuclease of OLD family